VKSHRVREPHPREGIEEVAGNFIHPKKDPLWA
jgi:hypothetical protein